ncbi:unnamed protein product, partial [Urochloa humidicola]
ELLSVLIGVAAGEGLEKLPPLCFPSNMCAAGGGNMRYVH